MRILILALGSRGDVQPLIVLGTALRQAGHAVRLATFEYFRSLVEERGLEFFPISGNIQSMLGQAGESGIANAGRGYLQTTIAILKNFGPRAINFDADMADPRLLQTDLVINQLPGGLFGWDIAEKLGIPHVAAAVIPMQRTRHMPMLAFPTFPSRLPGYNQLTFRIAEQTVWQVFRPAVNRFRRRFLGLPAAPLFGPFAEMQRRRAPVICGFSRHVVPPPPDWKANIHLTGYWHDPPGNWQPPSDLLHFLEAGAPPVFIGFGSMPIRDGVRITRLAVDALQQAGQRGIIGRAWSNLAQNSLPPEIFALDTAPYTWLFPLLAAIVHHGGSGTTACAHRSGVPSLVIPFVFDQFYWGRRTAELNAGPPPIPFKSLTAPALAAALRRMTTDAVIQRSAAALGARLQSEDGIAAALQVIASLTA